MSLKSDLEKKKRALQKKLQELQPIVNKNKNNIRVLQKQYKQSLEQRFKDNSPAKKAYDSERFYKVIDTYKKGLIERPKVQDNDYE